MPTNPAGYGYYRALSSLTNAVSWVDLSPLGPDFGLAKSDGSDVLIYDFTADAAVPSWLSDFDPVAHTGRIWFKASNVAHEHRLYYGNPSATIATNFASIFTAGTGFDSGWGDLATNVSGAGAASRFAAASGPTDNQGIRIFRRSTVATIGTGQWPNRPVVREFTLLTDPDGKIVQDGGVYVAYYIAQNTSDPTYPGQTYRCTSTNLITWSNHSLVMGVGTSGAYDDNGARVATVLKMGTGDYRMWYTASGSTAGPGVGYATSTDGLTWTKVGQLLNNSNCGITVISPYLSAVPDVRRLANGTYVMFCEVRSSTGSGYPWHVFGWTSPNVTNGGTWTVMNSGSYVINGASNGLTTYGIANAHIWERGVGDYLMYCEAFTGSGTDLTTFNGQAAFWHATAPSGPYTLVNEAIAGRINVNPSNFGTEAGGMALMPDGTPVFFIQDYPAADNLNTVANIYRIYPVKERMGHFNTAAAADAALASMVLAAGTFTLENRGNLTTHRSGDNAIYVLGLADAAAALTADTTTNNLAKFRVAIRHHCFSSNQQAVPSGIAPGSLSFLYWDGSGTIHFYNGAPTPGTWTLLNNSFEAPAIADGMTLDFSDTGGASWASSSGFAFLSRSSTYDGAGAKPDGAQCAGIYDAGWISQDVAVTPGGTYTISFRAEGAVANNPNTILIKVDGTTVHTITPTTGVWASYTTPQFTVSSGTHTIRFEGSSSGGSVSCIDLVTVDPVSTTGWGTTNTAVAAAPDTLREAIYRIDDDGTNFVLSARYSDDNSLIASASIAKSSVKAFSNSRVMFSGVPFTNANYGGFYSRRISTRPYAASEPLLSLDGQNAIGGGSPTPTPTPTPTPGVILPGGSLRNIIRRPPPSTSVSVVRRRHRVRLD